MLTPDPEEQRDYEANRADTQYTDGLIGGTPMLILDTNQDAKTLRELADRMKRNPHAISDDELRRYGVQIETMLRKSFIHVPSDTPFYEEMG
jgi:hypothetical protein